MVEAYSPSQWLYSEDCEFGVSSPGHVIDEPSKTPCPPYTLKWTLCQKKTRLHKLTGNAVQNITSYPSIFWGDELESEITDVVAQKRLANTHEAEETQLVFSINARGEEAIPRRFSGSDVNWAEHEIANPPKKRKQVDDPHINITNVMPGMEATPVAKKIRIVGCRDIAIQRYRDWHCGKVDGLDWKEEFHAIAQLTLQARLSLDRLHAAQEEQVKYFLSHGISRGIAHQWVSMVEEWWAETSQM
ncbi:uncharacterized protein J7T54_005375 [Emericellopsis cladophorae]|uniref:Uncharacterized protein n=1 Tax=Emericellopsis cladophorae TaxID=2686198 RepID=A0A9Q0BB20_9HYPO|nr:uncharacterized protein J7T54_005375 [Emericellopsis cladophorae]KAI6777589.1 hypothetical protein J7T54_005375 [Emericellopsis cladophorae]